ncbi:fructosamine kinase family protein [Phycicoccus flavus]|uniref:fructosamine kinase family protein n=1 Tax=Phycicoccus flavus TaxID=2502783 RepID=UPI000FEB808A|nr:fructosamine kinase family protein [Phycicoccus flavus]NHA68832.1 phosphotransferase [Phycicoccus flavus]
MTRRHRKSSATAPAGYFAWEAAGLRWLRAADGASVVEVRDEGEDFLELPWLESAGATPEGAEALGRGLARTHAAGASAFGAPPEGWEGDGWLGPLSEPLPLTVGAWDSWGRFYGEARVLPMARAGRERGTFDATDVDRLEALASRLAGGEHDTDDAPARLHGDLWSGNVMWTADGAVLIDPAAHGGHREGDLAMLALFGCPHLDRVLAAYDEAAPLAAGWRDRVLLHQLHPLLVHAVLFGGSYVRQALAAADRYR